MGLAQGKKKKKLRIEVHIAAMKTRKGAIGIERLDERRYAVTVDGVVRYVGTHEECQQRVAMLTQKKDRVDQDEALARSVRRLR
jgi:hypothetical protein